MFEQEKLLEQLGDPYTSKVVERLHRFAYIPPVIIESLAREALNEHWGRDNYALMKYLAVHIAWSIENGRYTFSGNQFYVTAGHLQTRYGTPLYLVFGVNQGSSVIPWRLITAGSQISAPELPAPPEIPPSPNIPKGAEIVMMHDHILGDNAERVPFLNETPPVAQMCAVSGAIQWSLNRNLQLPYWYFGKMNFLVPLYLQNRENITLSPDLIAPIQVNPDYLLVRTVLEPVMPYPNARVAVRRHDQLPPWMLASWAEYVVTASTSQIEDPENGNSNNS
ncbi:MAG: DUF3825 domain-containing protein [Acidobacteria bacterium]|nr:DUF3825 domain-containing protein [Acidobacteriota bacterium]